MGDHDQGIARAGRGEEEPKDKQRAEAANQTEPGTMPTHPSHEQSDRKSQKEE
jgi:hypothetical protein